MYEPVIFERHFVVGTVVLRPHPGNSAKIVFASHYFLNFPIGYRKTFKFFSFDSLKILKI